MQNVKQGTLIERRPPGAPGLRKVTQEKNIKSSEALDIAQHN